MSVDAKIVSVIIPMRNEEKYIGCCLESLLANDFPQSEMEILVVDGRSTDRSRAVVEEKMRQHGCIQLVDNPKGIVPTGLNVAIRQAKGHYIIRMDAHSQYPSDYIRSCVEELERTGASVVGGSMVTMAGATTLTGQAIALMSQHPFGVGNSGFRIGWSDRYVDTVPFGAFRREVFEQVGLFKETLVRNQDFEMNSRIRAAGEKIFLSSKIRLTYFNVPSLSKFLRQAWLNGIWLGRCWVCSPVSFCKRHAVPAAFVTALLLSTLAGIYFRPALLVGVSALLAYCLLATASAVQIAYRNGARFLLIMPALFFVYHFTYGMGTLWGLFTFSRAREQEESASAVLDSRKAA